MIASRIVLDTNACLDLFVFADPRTAGLAAALGARRAVAVTREDCRAEWLRVLHYPKLGLDDSAREHHAAAFDALVTQVDAELRPLVPLPRCKDADDQKFLELAWQAGAVALLTRDDALLTLARRARRDGLFDISTPEAWCIASGAFAPGR